MTVNQNPPTQPVVNITPEQAIGLALMDNAAAMMQFSANQTGGFFKQKDLGDFFAGLCHHIEQQKVKFIEEWGRKVKLVGADSLPPPPKVH